MTVEARRSLALTVGVAVTLWTLGPGEALLLGLAWLLWCEVEA